GLSLSKPDTPSRGAEDPPLQLLYVPAQGLDGFHERLVCHSLAPPDIWTVHSRAGCRFICCAVRKPSSLDAKNRNRLSSPVVLIRRATSDDRPRPLRAAKR